MINETYITISRYAMVNGFPVMEQVRWAPAEEGDLRGIKLPTYDGMWVWTSAFNLLIDYKWFGQNIEWEPTSAYWDVYNLPLRKDVKLITIEEFNKHVEKYKLNAESINTFPPTTLLEQK